MPPKGSAWLTADEVLALFMSGTPSKLGQELARGVDPNQRLEIPKLDTLNQPTTSLLEVWPAVPEHHRASAARSGTSCCCRREVLTAPPPHRSSRQTGLGTPAGTSACRFRRRKAVAAEAAGTQLRRFRRCRWTGVGRWWWLRVWWGKIRNCWGGCSKRGRMLVKHGFNRWGAVRRDSLVDAVLTVLLGMVQAQRNARRAMADRLKHGPAAQSKKAGGGGGRGGGGRGGGGGGGGGGAAAAILETCQRQLAECCELLQELMRRRCWPPCRGCPAYVAQPLTRQLALALLMADTTLPRVLGIMMATALGRNTATLHAAIELLCEVAGQRLYDSGGSSVPLMARHVLAKRLLAAGLRPEEPCVAAGEQPVNLLEPALLLAPDLMAAVLEAAAEDGGPTHGSPLARAVIPSCSSGPAGCPPWRSLLGESVAEGKPRTVLEMLLRHGADPRAIELGCIRPLTLAVLARNGEAYSTLLRAGAPASDAPRLPDPAQITSPAVKQQLRELLSRTSALLGAGAGAAEVEVEGAEQQRGEVAGGGVLGPHLGWLPYAEPGDLLNLVPLLASPQPATALTLLALLRCVNSFALRAVAAACGRQRRQEQERGRGRGRNRVGGGPAAEEAQEEEEEQEEDMAVEAAVMRSKAVECGPQAGVVAEFMFDKPACPYIPYLLMTFPYLLHHVLMNRKLIGLAAAPVAAMANRLDPPSNRFVPTTPTASTVTSTSTATTVTAALTTTTCPNGNGIGSIRGSSACGSGDSNSSSSKGCRNSGGGGCGGFVAAAAAADAAADTDGRGGPPPSSPTYPTPPSPPPPLARLPTTTSLAPPAPAPPPPAPPQPPPLLPSTSPEWPPEEEVPYEILLCMLRLPWRISTAPELVRHDLDVYRRNSRVMWESGYTGAVLRIAAAILRTQHRATAALSSSSAAAAGGGGVKGRRSSGGGGGSAAITAATVSCPAYICRWRLLSEIFAYSLLGLGPGCHDGPPALPLLTWLPTSLLLLYHDPWVRALVADGAIDAIACATHQAAAESAAAAEAEVEERLTRAVEAVSYAAVADMSFGFSFPPTPPVMDAWVSQRVTATLTARQDAAAAAAAATPPSGGFKAGGKKATKAAAGAAAASGTAASVLPYDPYGRYLSAVPHWVQTPVARWVWEVLQGVQGVVQQEGGSRKLAKALLEARARLGPPLG